MMKVLFLKSIIFISGLSCVILIHPQDASTLDSPLDSPICRRSSNLAAKKMTPPWPSKAFNLRRAPARRVAFSPSGSQLAFCINNCNPDQHVVHVWDPWGDKILLGGHTGKTHCLEHSLDGEHLASGTSADGLIRIWRTESFHATSSQTHMERPTRTPKQADMIVAGCCLHCTALSFSRTDSSLLASGGMHGEFKVWNIKDQACIHSFDPQRSAVRYLVFAGGAVSACIALADNGSVIRIWRAKGASDFASETIGEADLGGWSYRDAVFSHSGSFF
jgi:WD40 repeat protein